MKNKTTKTTKTIKEMVTEIPNFFMGRIDKKALTPKQLSRRKRKALEQWNNSVMNSSTPGVKEFEPKLAVLAREVIEKYTPGIKWSYPESPIRIESSELPSAQDPLAAERELVEALTKSALDGLVDQAQITLEDKLLEILPPLINRFRPSVIKQVLRKIDPDIVDYILEKQIVEKQQIIADLEKQTQTLQQWKQTTKSE